MQRTLNTHAGPALATEKPYQRPALVVIGPVEQFTLGASGPLVDGGSGRPKAT